MQCAALRQAGLPAAQEVPPAVDILFNLFEFILSPAGLGAIFGLIAIGFIWDFATAVDNRTLLGQKRQVRHSSSAWFCVFADLCWSFLKSPVINGSTVILTGW